MASNGLAAVRLLRPGNKAIGSWTGLVHAIPIALCATTVIQPARQLVTIGDCLLLRHCLPEAKRGFVLLPRCCLSKYFASLTGKISLYLHNLTCKNSTLRHITFRRIILKRFLTIGIAQTVFFTGIVKNYVSERFLNETKLWLPPLLDVLKLSHMDTVLTSDEKRLVEYAKQAIVKYNIIRHAHGGIDTLYAFLLSDSGKIHDGACYEPILSHATVCGERHAIANMILQESYKAKIKSIVVADPVPEVQEHGRSPCGTCRHLIWSQGSPDTTVILLQYIQGKDAWTFPKLEKYTAKDFYPLPYEPNEHFWDNWEPK